MGRKQAIIFSTSTCVPTVGRKHLNGANLCTSTCAPTVGRKDLSAMRVQFARIKPRGEIRIQPLLVQPSHTISPLTVRARSQLDFTLIQEQSGLQKLLRMRVTTCHSAMQLPLQGSTLNRKFTEQLEISNATPGEVLRHRHS